jgi:DNA polymerase III sliding clamp (beta) subunit (PCNA family)
MSASSEFGGSSSDEILVEKAFPADRAIGLNARYFLDVIAVIDDEAVRLIVEEGLRPLTILEKTPEFTYTHMVMPLRI